MSGSACIRTLIIDDESLARERIRDMLASQPQIEIIGDCANGQEAIELFRQHQPDITLMDLRMPIIGGVDAISRIRQEFPTARIIVLTTYDGDEDIYRSLQAGAQGYLLKDMFFEELEQAIRRVHAGSRLIPGPVAERLAERMSGSNLTGRELEVLEEIVRGRSNKEIAGILSISEATVKSHINNLLSKLGVTDRTQAATTALQRGIVHFNKR